MIDIAEDREKFKELLDTLSLRQPENSIITILMLLNLKQERLVFLWW